MTESVVEAKQQTVIIYTDGACSGNPGRGGYGVILKYGGHRRELSGGFRLTTNNRMEIMAAIVALETLKRPCKAKLYTDSRYLADAIKLGWAKKWKRLGWMRNKKEPALNPDLWERLLQLCDKHEVDFIWVRGHADNPDNEHCDQLAVAASHGSALQDDLGYPPK